jgi:hypothetical protein
MWGGSFSRSGETIESEGFGASALASGADQAAGKKTERYNE